MTGNDEEGVAVVVLSIDGVPFATDTRASYRFVLDAIQFSPGLHELSFVATDFSGNVSATRTLEVTFVASSGTSRHTTEIVFRSPTDGATVSRNVTIQATISDGDGLALVEWFVDGTSQLITPATGLSTGVSFVWRTGEALPGEHVVTLVVTDITGRQTTGALRLLTR